MNVVFIVLDSFRQDHVSLYNGGVAPFSGIDPCRTPNIDAFAEEAVVFDNAYPEALPTIPIRCQLMTGQRTLHSRGWQPLTAEDAHVAQVLSEEGYVCGLVTDTYHFRAPGMNYHRNFASYDWIRGQEYDPWISAPTMPPATPAPVKAPAKIWPKAQPIMLAFMIRMTSAVRT